MKTLCLYILQVYLFSTCTCIFGYLQPRPNRDSSSKVENVDYAIEKCPKAKYDIRKTDFVDPDDLLCFGLKVFTQRFRGELDDSALLDVEKKSDTDICKHFQEMRLISTQDKLNESEERYNLQFKNKESCEKACVDVMHNVNPLCKIILLLSLNTKGDPIGNDDRPPSPVLSGDNEDNENNEVPGHSRRNMDNVPGRSVSAGKTGDVDLERVNVDQTIASAQERTVKGQKLQDGDQSPSQNTKGISPAQTSQGIRSELSYDLGKSREQTRPTGVREGGSVKEKEKTKSEGRPVITEKAREQNSTSGLPGEVINTSKKTSDSKEQTKVSNVVHEHLAEDSKNEGNVDSLRQENKMTPSSDVLPENSGDGKIEQVTATRSKLQVEISTVKDRVTSKKVNTDGHVKDGESISQVPKIEEGKGIVNNQKSQADNKETETPSQKVTELQTTSKMVTEVIQKSNAGEQKTNQNSGKSHTYETAETASKSDKTETQKTIIDEGHSTDDTGDHVAELHTQLSVEAGELPDVNEFSSGGGTGVYYARPDSDDLETDKNGVDAGAILIHERYDEADDDSHFFAYFMTTMVFCIVGYLLFHNKQKILALALEGRARRGRRRPNTSGYRKLDSNLEEAISSSKSASVTQVIY